MTAREFAKTWVLAANRTLEDADYDFAEAYAKYLQDAPVSSQAPAPQSENCTCVDLVKHEKGCIVSKTKPGWPIPTELRAWLYQQRNDGEAGSVLDYRGDFEIVVRLIHEYTMWAAQPSGDSTQPEIREKE